MIIDAHAEFGPGLGTDSPLQPRLSTVTDDELIAHLDEAGIDKAVVHAPRWLGGRARADFVDPEYEVANSVIGEGARRHPDRIIPFARISPKFGSLASQQLDRLLDHGFRGVYLDNAADGFAYDDLGLLRPVLERCAERSAPALLFTWQAPSQPFQLVTLARAFPRCTFIVAHSGWRLGGDAVAAAELTPNIYLETSFAGMGVIPAAAKRLGAQRVIFGTNIPYGLPELELRRIRRWGQLDAAQLDQVLGGNIATLLSIAA